MGNTYPGIQQHIREEFERLFKQAKAQPNRDWIVIDQLLQFNMERPEQLRLHKVDFTHIGTLFVLDTDRRGQFRLERILEFADLCKICADKYFRGEDFEAKFKAY